MIAILGKPIGQWKKNLVMPMGFVDHLGSYKIEDFNRTLGKMNGS